MHCLEPMMDEDEALALLLETNQLTDLELHLLETCEASEHLSPQLQIVSGQAVMKLMLAQALPPTMSLH